MRRFASSAFSNCGSALVNSSVAKNNCGCSPVASVALPNTNYSYPWYTDGRMVRGALFNLEQDARKLQKIITDDDTLPPWVTWKIYTADDRVQAATRYMERQATLAKKNPVAVQPVLADRTEEGSFMTPFNVAVMAGFLGIAGYLVYRRQQA